MKIAILGYSLQGQSALEYWNTPGNEVTICDRDDTIVGPSGIQTQLGPDYLKDLGHYDLLVRTPALHPRDITAANPGNPAILDKITTNTNEFFRVCPTKHIIGVTGTKGKGTTSTLITRMLEAAGQRVHLGGNIGTPPLELLKADIKGEDWVVLELANFQLIDLKYSPPIAVCLMVVPEHLDWHTDMAEYTEAKSQLFSHQKANDVAIYYAFNDESHRIAAKSPGVLTPYMEAPGAYVRDDMVVIGDAQFCATSELKLLGKHNWQNVCAAVTAVWQITQDVTALRSALTAFTGLEHRLELVRELDEVRYYDDSFGTTPSTAIVALEAFREPKVIILGGSDKGAHYDELAEAITRNDVRHVLLIGEQASRIQAALDKVGFRAYSAGGNSMTEIVANARQVAQPSDVILLSTACASFDMFKNYKDRGEQFTKAVQALV